MKTSFVVICLALACIKGLAQDQAIEKILADAQTWREGNILLNDGTQLSGSLRMDYNSGIISFRRGEVNKTLAARTVSRFEFFDGQSGKRSFVSFEYEDKKSSRQFYFFEVLKEFESFAVLSKTDPVKALVKTENKGSFFVPGWDYYSRGTVYKNIEFYLTETICFMDTTGNIKPYLRIVDIEKRSLLGNTRQSINRFIAKKLLARHTRDRYSELAEYTGKNGLNLKLKNDLLTFLDLYSEPALEDR